MRYLSILFLIFLFGCEKKPELGLEEYPVVWAFVSSVEIEIVTASAEKIVELLNRETGLFFDIYIASDYEGVIEALSSDPPKAHIASLPTFTYILAADRGIVEAALVSVRFGQAVYNGQLIVHAGSGIRKIQQLEGRTFARPDPLSTSGWLMPMLTMRSAGLNPEQDLADIVDTGSHEAVVEAVYNGEVDAGSTYMDARDRLLAVYPDVKDAVVVMDVTQDIPNDGIQFVPSMPEEMKNKIVEALLAIADTEEGKEAFFMAYEREALEKHDDTFYDSFREVLKASGLGIDALRE